MCIGDAEPVEILMRWKLHDAAINFPRRRNAQGKTSTIALRGGEAAAARQIAQRAYVARPMYWSAAP